MSQIQVSVKKPITIVNESNFNCTNYQKLPILITDDDMKKDFSLKPIDDFCIDMGFIEDSKKVENLTPDKGVQKLLISEGKNLEG